MATKKVKVLKFPKTVYLNWAESHGNESDYLYVYKELSDFTDDMDSESINGEYIAVYELKSVNLLEVKPTLTPVK